MSRISPEPYFHSMNGPLWIRNSSEGAPASLYNPTKSAPDPLRIGLLDLCSLKWITLLNQMIVVTNW